MGRVPSADLPARAAAAIDGGLAAEFNLPCGQSLNRIELIDVSG